MEYVYLFVVIGVIISTSDCQPLKVITTDIGGTATLTCPISQLDSELKFIYWMKSETTIYSYTTAGEHAREKYSVIDNTTLVVPDLVASDTGNYSCKVVLRSDAIHTQTTQLYIIDFSVDHCKDTKPLQHDVSDCNCSINGANITSLSCSATGLQQPPLVSWEGKGYIVTSSSVDLERFGERGVNETFICKTRHRDFEDVKANMSVCVYYPPSDEKKLSGLTSPDDPGINTSLVLAITLSLIVILVALIGLVVYIKKRGNPFSKVWRRLQTTPQTKSAKDDLKYNAIQLKMKSVEDDIESLDLPDKDCNKEIIFEDAPEVSYPLVGQVMLDDLRNMSDKAKKLSKAVIVRLLNKRVHPYREDQEAINANIHPMLASGVQNPMRESVMRGSSEDRDIALVDLFLKQLDQIPVERDRDECEILITTPSFQEVTEKSKIPEFQGNKIIKSVPCVQLHHAHVHHNNAPLMVSGMGACSLESTVILEELKDMNPTERTEVRNVISQFILDGLRSRTRPWKNADMLQSDYRAEDLPDENARLVALWNSKLVKLDYDVTNKITEYLFPLKPREPKEDQTAQEDEDPAVAGATNQETERSGEKNIENNGEAMDVKVNGSLKESIESVEKLGSYKIQDSGAYGSETECSKDSFQK